MRIRTSHAGPGMLMLMMLLVAGTTSLFRLRALAEDPDPSDPLALPSESTAQPADPGLRSAQTPTDPDAEAKIYRALLSQLGSIDYQERERAQNAILMKGLSA